MRRMIAVAVLLLLIGLLPLAAQSDLPDYAVNDVRSEFSEDGSEIVVEFDVENLGDDADDSATVSLSIVGTGQLIDDITLRPLREDEVLTLRFTFASNVFPAGSSQTLQALVELDEEDTATLDDNAALICVVISPDVPFTSGACPATDFVTTLMDQLGIQFDASDDNQVIQAVGLGAAVLLLLVILWVIIRLMFQKAPAFGTGRPPYATLQPMDVNTISGRRQLWQQHGQNGSLPTQVTEGSVQARKLLLGMDNILLSGWRVKAMRMSQYDAYGRVAHSQVLVPDRMVKLLNRAAHTRRNNKVKRDQRERTIRQLRPIARTLANQFKRKMNTRNAMLPIALDVRVEGTHGEVRIVFELFQGVNGYWQQIDGWEPEMTVLGKTIHESYTFTVYGQLPGEQFRDFKRRLPDDIARFLSEVVMPVDPVPPPPAAPAAPETGSDTPTSQTTPVNL